MGQFPANKNIPGPKTLTLKHKMAILQKKKMCNDSDYSWKMYAQTNPLPPPHK
jgi:hypothetical protein